MKSALDSQCVNIEATVRPGKNIVESISPECNKVLLILRVLWRNSMRARSAISGKYVTLRYAKSHPKTTIIEN